MTPSLFDALTWRFPSTGGGEVTGINDPMVSHFTDDWGSLARETIQNSLDARLDPGQPVRVVFRMSSMSSRDFPGRDELRRIMEQAAAFAAGGSNASGVYNRALTALRGRELTVLTVTDSNTTGLEGSDDDHTGSWNRLTRQTGGSAKDAGAGGSFGVGKGAPFALSVLRTVYYSTRTADGVAFIGRARLSSFRENGDIRQGGGFFGISDPPGRPRQTLSVRDQPLIPACFPPPDTRGTSIYIPVSLTDGRLNRLLRESVRAVIRSFWAAIHRGNLHVTFEGFGDTPLLIDTSTLPAVMAAYEDPAHLITPYYTAFQQTPEVRELPGLGEVKLYLLVGDDLPKRTVWMRSPLMVVREKRSTTPVSFAAVLLCDSPGGNGLLRLMEPPEHNDWLVARAPVDQRRAAQEALDALQAFVRDAVRAAGTLNPGELHDIPALQELLPGAEEHSIRLKSTGRDSTVRETEQETGRLRNAVTPDTPARVSTSRKATHDVQLLKRSGSGQLRSRPPAREPGTPSGTTSPGRSSGSHTPAGQRFEVTAGRIWLVREDGRNVYRVSLQGTPGLTGAIRLKLQSEDAELTPGLSSVQARDGTPLPTTGNVIHDVQLDAQGAQLLTVRLREPGRYCLTFEQEEPA